MWVASSDIKALNSAISAANVVLNNSKASQSDINNAVIALNNAVSTFNGKKQYGSKSSSTTESVNKSELNAVIATAEKDKDSVIASADSSDVYQAENWVSTTDSQVFLEAINVAKSINNNSKVSQSDVNNAVIALHNAISDFDVKKKKGTKVSSTIELVDKSMLQTAISKANSNNESVKVSIDGTDVSSLDKWVTSSNKQDLTKAITEAASVLNNISVSQTDVNSAVTALNNAVSDFDGKKKSGTKVVSTTKNVGKQSLNRAISLANIKKYTVKISSDGSDVSILYKWVTPSEIGNLNSSISEAESVLNNRDSSQNDIDNATAVLNESSSNFDTNKKFGTKFSTYADENKDNTREEFQTAINKGFSDIYTVVSSIRGEDVYQSNQWMDENDVRYLKSAVSHAQKEFYNNKASESTINDEITDLNKKIAIFDKNKKNGTKDSSYTSDYVDADKSALVRALVTARADKLSVPVSTDGLDIIESGTWVTWTDNLILENATVHAFSFWDDRDASQADVDNAIIVLNNAIFDFDVKKQKGKIPETDKRDLLYAWSMAGNDVGSANISIDGSGIYTIRKWVLQEDHDALYEVIKSTRKVLFDTYATKAEIDNATAELYSAIPVFDSKKRDGLKPWDKAELQQLVKESESNLASVSVSVDGSDIESTKQWVTQKESWNYDTQINYARMVVDLDDMYTDEDVKNSIVAIKQATQNFNSNKKYGTKNP